ncbi:type II secretion system F family protein [Salinarchaeum laminariae]|uniref:type II secretion system F family protein n=1 Tax=Salinarchaeum laminariae TaxID=869888 RepID=UPI0020C034A6|nr:type II secretion system F family protein [Salinarchaeum laminariae]
MSLDTLGESGQGTTVSGADSLGDAFYPLYERLFSEDSEFVGDLETKLAQARMADTVELYISRALAIGTITGVSLWIVGTLLGYLLFATGMIDLGSAVIVQNVSSGVADVLKLLRVPLLVLVTGLVFGSLGFVMGFGVLIAVPYSRASTRKREINMLLPDAVAFMYALSVGGLNQLEILQAMAEADDTYGEVSREFKSIVQETQYFDTDYRTAIRNQALSTPSDELAQFLTDMLSIVSSGGNMQAFLDDKKDKHMRTAKQQQEMTLETLELFGEMYMTLSLFPLLLIIILVIMMMIGEAQSMMIYATVYALVPLTGLGFLVLVSTVKQDEVGDGFLMPGSGSERLRQQQRSGLLNLGLVETFTGEYSVFDRIKNREGSYEATQIIKKPHLFFRESPLYTLAITVPLALVVVGTAIGTGSAPTTWQGMIDAPVWGTFLFVYLPAYMVLVPLTVFYEWNVRSRYGVTNNLSDNLRKLSSANDTGLTLLESFYTVADTTSGKLATEFQTMHAKVNYGMSLREALVEFNNKYHIPRLARTVKLISKAQEASSQITDVLRTAATASENQDDINRERKSRTRMQVVIIMMTFLTLLAVMAILQTQFLETMAELTSGTDQDSLEQAGGSFNLGAIDPSELSLLFFHAVTMQAILSGFISGYMRDADILSGVKYVVVLLTIALSVWMFVG